MALHSKGPRKGPFLMQTRSPILYEVNTRVWIRELRERTGRPVTLADIPEAELNHWSKMGFTHIWLMGVWQVGPEARRIALEHWQSDWKREGFSSEENVLGSPFAIQGYSVDSRLGQPLDLLLLKERFELAGLRLVLDFVPNHFGIDSVQPEHYPARFVQAQSLVAGTFRRETSFGTRFFAHGRDPYFPPWLDTVQIDYRVAEAHESMCSVAQTVSMFCHGLRCDMAMLLLPEIFQNVWGQFPSVGSHTTEKNFWRTAIPAMRSLQANVEVIAEAYWGREPELQEAGFDFTYNKTVTDHLVHGENAQLIDFLYGRPVNELRRSVHFLENHDEQRAAAAFSPRRHKMAAALILFLPGMVLLHDGQLEGRKRFARIQLDNRPTETVDAEIQGFYIHLLTFLGETSIRQGEPEMIRLAHVFGLVAILWRAPGSTSDLAIVNLQNNATTILLSGISTFRDLKCLYSTDLPPQIDGESVTLPPESAHIFRLA